ncbi:hypothetical protein HGRIS_001714 [Hohenbuehelia grisea]|uniref:Uncharacterized protein n=1 Tax=Hohenbuehelia grisea TaxID=104357 RepID=A0ABR3JI86_9AGAR
MPPGPIPTRITSLVEEISAKDDSPLQAAAYIRELFHRREPELSSSNIVIVNFNGSRVTITSMPDLHRFVEAVTKDNQFGKEVQSFWLILNSKKIPCQAIGMAFGSLRSRLTNLSYMKCSAPSACPKTLAYVFRALLHGAVAIDLEIAPGKDSQLPRHCQWHDAIKDTHRPPLYQRPKSILQSFVGPAPLVMTLGESAMASLRKVKLDFPKSSTVHIADIIGTLSVGCGSSLTHLTCLRDPDLRDPDNHTLLSLINGLYEGFPRLEVLVITGRNQYQDSHNGTHNTSIISKDADAVLELASQMMSLRFFRFDQFDASQLVLGKVNLKLLDKSPYLRTCVLFGRRYCRVNFELGWVACPSSDEAALTSPCTTCFTSL